MRNAIVVLSVVMAFFFSFAGEAGVTLPSYTIEGLGEGVDDSFKPLLGAWIGTWDPAPEAALIVRKISNVGGKLTASIIYAWDAYSVRGSSSAGGSYEKEAEVFLKEGYPAISFTSPKGGEFKFRLKPDGTLYGIRTFPGGGLYDALLRKVN